MGPLMSTSPFVGTTSFQIRMQIKPFDRGLESCEQTDGKTDPREVCMMLMRQRTPPTVLEKSTERCVRKCDHAKKLPKSRAMANRFLPRRFTNGS